jgi:hypothetical protein
VSVRSWAARRLALGVAQTAGVVVLVFLLTEALPGDAAVAFAGDQPDPERIERVREIMRLDRPATERFAEWAGGLLTGDLGAARGPGRARPRAAARPARAGGRGAPPPPPDRRGILLGYGIGALGRWAVTALVLTAVAMLAGMEVGGNGVDVFALYALAALVNVAGLLWSAGVAMRLRTLQAAPLMQLPVFLSLFFAPVFVPVELLADWLEAIARLNPVTLMLEAGRSLIAGNPAHLAGGFGGVLALIALFSIWAVRGLRRAEAAGG